MFASITSVFKNTVGLPFKYPKATLCAAAVAAVAFPAAAGAVITKGSELAVGGVTSGLEGLQHLTS